MNINPASLIDSLKTTKGQFKSITWVRPCNLKKSVQNVTITKETTVVCRTGINYDNLAIVKEARINGDLPAVNAGLNGKSWAIFPFLLLGREGNAMLRVYPMDAIQGTRTVTYKMDGKIVNPDALRNLIMSSDLPKPASIVQDIPLSYITDISF